MARFTLNQNSFTSGELSPRVLKRTDNERYAQGMKYARNCHPVKEGGFKRRAGSIFTTEALTNVSGESILVPFVEGQGRAWMLEFGHQTVRVLTPLGVPTGVSLTTSYTAAQLSLLDWAQSDSTLWTAHPMVLPQRLQRFTDSIWVMGPAPFSTMPFDEVGHIPSTSLTLSALSVGVGRTATAGASAFNDSDVGRAIVCRAGIGVITGYTSATVVTVEITRAFDSTNLTSLAWTIEGSPQCFVYPQTAKPAGVLCTLHAAVSRAANLLLSDVTGTITINAGAAVFSAGDVGKFLFAGTGMATIASFATTQQVTATVINTFDSKTYDLGAWAMPGVAWRSGDVGSKVRINGGLVRIDQVSSSSVARGTILRELSGAVLAPALSWTLEQSVWTATLGFPRTVTIHGQRSVFAGTTKYPRTVWGSRIGEPLDFERWTNDSDSFAWTIDSDECTPIRFVTSSKQLAALTESAEYSMRNGVEKGLTPTNVRVEPESNHGCAQVRPTQINKEQVFVQSAGTKVRAFGYRYDFDAYTSPDLTGLAGHITKSGITCMTYAQEAEQMLWATRADGKFLTCTIDRDQQPSVIGWALHETDGFMECVQSIPSGDRNTVFAIVRRTINGVQKRYIERFDDQMSALFPESELPDGLDEAPVYGCTVDCAKVADNDVGLVGFNVSHLVGKRIAIVSDGSVIFDGYSDDSPIVPADGNIYLARPGKRNIAGLPFKSKGTLLTPEVQTGAGSAQGQPARTGEMFIHFLATVGAKVKNNQGNEQTIPFKQFGPGVLNQMPIPFTGGLKVTLLGWERGESEISIIQEQPLPMHVLAVVRTHQVGGA